MPFDSFPSVPPPSSCSSFITCPPPPDNHFPLNTWKSRFDKKPVSRNPVIAVLDIEYNELAQAWRRLRAFLPLECQAEFHERPQDAQALLTEIRNVQASWISSPRQRIFTRSMTLCDDFISTVDAHSFLLPTLPEPESYLALFYGTVQATIKASANFPRIMEGLVKLLIEINKAIRLPAGTEPPSFGKDAVPAIAKFYALTFFFLGEFMDWYARKAACRLLQSHSLDPYSDFHTLISCIKETTRGMDVNRVDMDDGECERETRILKQNAPHLWEEARLNQVGLNGSDRRFASQNAMLHQLIWEIQHDAAQRVRLKMERELRLLQLQNSVRGQFSAVPDQSSGIACLMATRTQDLDASGAECAQSPKRKFTRIDLQLASRHLDGFFDSDHWIADFGSDIELMAENNVATSLQEWITDSRPQFLAVGGSPTTAFCSPAALISGCYASFARRFKVPVISHFCSLPSQAAEGITPAQQGVVSLTYSLIRQLVDYLPPVLDCSVTCDLSAERFSLLDGTLTSWKEVLSLIDILLHYAPPLLVCVIDGLDALQDSTTKLYVQSLIRVFLTHMRYHSAPMPDGSKSFPVLLKVLFTVAGKLGPLEEVLAENQRVTSEPLQTPPLISDADAVITSA